MEQNGLEVMENKSTGVKVRDIEVITKEIKDLSNQAKTMALVYVVEIGRRLVEAKAALPYGKWGDWLKNEVEFSPTTATNYMRLFEEYGASQISIFGATVDSQSFAQLPYTKALQLLAVPEDEREQFAKDVGAEDLSVRELKEAIEERDRAIKDAKEAKEREELMAKALAEAESAAAATTAISEETARLREELAAKEEKLAKEKDRADTLRKALKNAEENPTIPKAEIEKIRNEAEDAAKKKIGAETNKAIADLSKQLEELKAKETAARQAEEQAKKRLEETEKRLKTASPEVTAFKALFDTMQETAAKLRAMLEKIRQSDPEMAEKLTNALKALGASLA